MRRDSGRRSRASQAPLLETLEPRQLLAASIGSLDVANSNKLVGWAYDADAGASSIRIVATVNGVGQGVVTANVARPDLQGALGSQNHGFNITLDPNVLNIGANSIVIYAEDLPTGQPAQIIGTATVYRPLGFIDVANATKISGWAGDKDGGGPLDIRIDIDGVTYATTTANLTRNDLVGFLGTSSAGFSVDVSGLSLALHEVEVFAKDPQNGDFVKIATTTINGNTAPIGVVDTINATTISGWAWDKDLAPGPVFIKYQIDSFSPRFVSANGSRPDLNSFLGSSNHGFNISLPNLTAGNHTIKVWALDSVNANLVLLKEQVINIANSGGDQLPYGSLDVFAGNSSTLQGWAYDPNAGASPIQVRVDVDGSTVTTVTANQTRNDLTAFLGSPNHAFSVNIGTLTTGSHRVDIYAINPQTSQPILIASKIRRDGTTRPTTTHLGSVDVINATEISGWAYSPSTPTTSVNVRVDVDGLIGAITSANLIRNDVAPFVDNNANVGFSITPPNVAAGTRRVVVSIIDPITFDAYVIKDTNVVFS